MVGGGGGGGGLEKEDGKASVGEKSGSPRPLVTRQPWHN